MVTKEKKTRVTAGHVAKTVNEVPRSRRNKAAGEIVIASNQADAGRKHRRSIPAVKQEKQVNAKAGRGELAVETDAKSAPSRPKSTTAGGDIQNGNETDVSPSGRETTIGGENTFGAKPRSAANRETTAGGGDLAVDSEMGHASSCQKLMQLQRRRAGAIKSRIAADNRLVATCATELFCSTVRTERESPEGRTARFALAGSIISAIRVTLKVSQKKKPTVSDRKKEAKARELLDANPAISGSMTLFVMANESTTSQYNRFIADLEVEMVALAKQLPATDWATGVKGFGLLRLAVIIGETGDLSNYANSDKVQKRLGLAPINGKMPSTWRGGKEGKLSSEEWSAAGYNPRRRSVAWQIGDLMVKSNFETKPGGEAWSETELEPAQPGLIQPDAGGELATKNDGQSAIPSGKSPGPYRQRYDEVKAASKLNPAHAEWPDGRHHNHAMLLCTKLLVKHLWLVWNKK